MKSKGNPKKNMSPESDRFDRKSASTNSLHKDRSSKHKLSIYDEFDDEENWKDLNYNSEEMDDTFDD
ncbi:MAG: hypothetical protein HQ541_21620 [Mariniphaga sp.]|nr:hypothetical protein [Mariniphaga sp.]